MRKPIVKICTLYILVSGYGYPQWLVVKLLFLVGSSLADVLGYLKFRYRGNIVEFFRFGLGSVQNPILACLVGRVCIWIDLTRF